MARITYGPALRIGLLGLTATLVGCATRTAGPVAVVPVAPVAAVPPAPPAGASATLALPPLGPDGRYVTVNSGLSPAATMWHVRSALNVAVLSCRGPQEAAQVASYNALLASKKALLARAFAATEAEARARYGKDWRDAHDRRMTTVYNFFAQPPAKAGFCAVAAEIGAEAATIPAPGFEAFAAAALPRLEAPFTAFYRDYNVYRRDLAAWQAGQAGRSAAAGAVAKPVVAQAAALPRTPGSARVAIAAATPPSATARPADMSIAPDPARAAVMSPLPPGTARTAPVAAGPAHVAVATPAPATARLAYAPVASIMAWDMRDATGASRLASAETARPRP